jgi:uric acid-xanthine permease
MDEDHGPTEIVPGEYKSRRSLPELMSRAKKKFTTRDGIVGHYDYAFLFKPNLPFMKKSDQTSPFFGLNDSMPLLLALLLGFQHALAMLAGVITPPIILGGSGGANLTVDYQQYLVSTGLIVSGLLSMIQITRFHIWKTPQVQPNPLFREDTH